MNIYTDGACSGNPGPGGWGVYSNDLEEVKLCGKDSYTTNNKMELTAVIEALDNFISLNHIIIHTDSIYVKNGVTQWIHKWKKNGWLTASKKPVKNKDLWIKILNLLKDRSQFTTEWKWVKAHDGNEGNEMADKLAKGLVD